MPSKSRNTSGLTRDKNQHGVIADVVLRYVVNTGVRSKQLGAAIEIHGYDK
jgi:hypothetical protein